MFQVLSRHSEGSSGIFPGISFCFYRPCYSPHNVCCLAWLWFQYIKFVWWFLKVKADGWSGWPASSWDLLSPWRITLYSLIPGSSALREPSWLPGGFHAVGTPSASAHSVCWDLSFPRWALLPRTTEALTWQSLGKWISSACLFYPLPVEFSLSQIRLSIRTQFK